MSKPSKRLTREFEAKVDELDALAHGILQEIKRTMRSADKDALLDMMPLLDLLIRAIKRMRRD